MVDISNRLEKMKSLVEDEEYFVINRGRQYGKTTTLVQLGKRLVGEYTVISLSFQGLGSSSFEHEAIFCKKFLENIDLYLERTSKSKDKLISWKNDNVTDFDLLSRHITEMCQHKKVVLMIDEVDRASNYRVFLDFLGMLRNKFILRNVGEDFTFQSVILAGVYDIKNIKFRMIQEGKYTLTTGERSNDSPWNIAENFAEEMAFSPVEIAGMLADYELDHQTGMEMNELAEEIYSYTSGYPFLVSRVCQYIHEKLEKNWLKASVLEAVRLITEEPQPNTLFDDLLKNILNNEALSNFLYRILMEGERLRFSPASEIISIGIRYAFIRIEKREVRIHNKIFEIIITDYFIDKERAGGKKLVDNRPDIDVVNGEQFNIELFFEKFNAHYQKHYSHRDENFIEREAAFLFLFFLQPYLNGKGAFHLESKPNLATGKRMDVVITYGNELYIVELKIWRGAKYQEKAHQQLLDYMAKQGVTKGYLLTFDFRQKKEIKQEWIQVDEKDILEVQV